MRTALGRIALLLLFCSGASPARVHADEVDEYIKSEMKRRQIPGLALAIVEDGRPVKVKGYGVAALEHMVPVKPETVFDLASVTKTFTATAAMMLVEEGRIELDEKISRYLGDVPEHWKGITVRHLLNHTSGLKNWFYPRYEGTYLRDYSTKQLYDYSAQLPLDFTPGERWHYSDPGYIVLGLVIEKVSGQRWAEFLSERILQPLGMTATSVVDQWQVVPNRAFGYILRDGKLVRNRRDIQDELPAGSGLRSIVLDLAKWDAALYTEKLLKRSTLEQMWTPARLNDGHYDYGLGWFLEDIRGHRVLAHRGGTGTAVFRLPEDRLTVIVLTNLDDGSHGTNAPSIARGVLRRHMPSLRVDSLREQPGQDPKLTTNLRQMLVDVSRGVASPLLVPARRQELDPSQRTSLASQVEQMQSFTFLACDIPQEGRSTRFGFAISRICHYKLTSPNETRYFSFYMTTDGRVAHFFSPLE